MKLAGFVFLLFWSMHVHGERFTSEKRISRHLTATPQNVLAINNSFGNVYVHTWNKNEINVEILIKGTAESKLKAREIADSTDVEEEYGDDQQRISFYANIQYNGGRGVARLSDSGHGYEASIEYTVYVPANLPLEITNAFGDIFVDDFKGKLSIDLHFGALHAQNITGESAFINLVFGEKWETSTIKSIDHGHIKGDSRSNISIDRATDLYIDGLDSLVINTVTNLNVSKEGYTQIGIVKEINGNVSGSLVIDELWSSSNLTLSDCNAVFKSIGSTNTEQVKVDIQRSRTSFHINEAANCYVSILSYPGRKNDLALREAYKFRQLTNKIKSYTRKSGIGGGTFLLNIHSDGDIREF